MEQIINGLFAEKWAILLKIVKKMNAGKPIVMKNVKYGVVLIVAKMLIVIKVLHSTCDTCHEVLDNEPNRDATLGARHRSRSEALVPARRLLATQEVSAGGDAIERYAHKRAAMASQRATNKDASSKEKEDWQAGAIRRDQIAIDIEYKSITRSYTKIHNKQQRANLQLNYIILINLFILSLPDIIPTLLKVSNTTSFLTLSSFDDFADKFGPLFISISFTFKLVSGAISHPNN